MRSCTLAKEKEEDKGGDHEEREGTKNQMRLASNT